MTDAPLLSVQNLTAAFRTNGQWNNVVRNLSFDLGARETLAIVGESGSGKSVTALSLMQLVSRANGRVSGRAIFGDRDLLSLSEPEMCRVRGNDIAMIFQEPMTSLNPVLTIGFQIGEALRYHWGLTGAAAELEAIRILSRVQIPAARERLNEYPHRFSGGMRQRVMIAMALACKPKILIADEPTTALDVTVQAQILELIKSLQDELDMAVLFITHDMGVVADVADRVLVMRHGEKVEEAETTALFAGARSAYAKALLGAIPRLGTMRNEPLPKRFPLIDVKTGLQQQGGTAAAPPIAGEAILKVRNLSSRFDVGRTLLGRIRGRVHAVENVSFDLAAGETLALVGESGCGKSTTGRSILRLIEPQAGIVEFEGRDVRTLNRAALNALRPRMQMIFQDPYASLDPRQPVGQAIAEPIRVHGVAQGDEADARVADLLRKVGLSPDMATRYPHEFSGGQRQRLCIARALSLSPKLIVADEAVSALDVSIKAQVVNLMMDLQAEFGIAYLFISHDMAVVERVSHRVAVMYLGEIVEIGPRAAIINDPQHPYTRKLLSAVPVADPLQRRSRRSLSVDEIKSPIRAPDYQPPVRRWREVAAGHLVQEVA